MSTFDNNLFIFFRSVLPMYLIPTSEHKTQDLDPLGEPAREYKALYYEDIYL